MSTQKTPREYAQNKDLSNPQDYFDVYCYAGKIQADLLRNIGMQEYLDGAPEQHKRIDWILSMVSKSVLDIGCGEGSVANFAAIQSHVTRSIGIDLSKDLLDYGNPGPAEFCSAHAEHIPFKDQSFNCIVLAEVLEHLIDSHKVLKEVYRLLKPHEKLIITVPYKEEEWLTGNDMINEQHVRSFTEESIVNLVTLEGFKCFSTISGELGEPFEYAYFNSAAKKWHKKIVQRRMTFIYLIGIKC